jgi:hypothetical protein
MGMGRTAERIKILKCPPAAFPPPWSVEVTPNGFIVRDANGQALSYTAPSIRRS